MADYRGFDILDYFVFIVLKKRFFILLSTTIAVLSYLSIYFLLPPQYDSTAMIVSVDEQGFNPISQIANSLSSIPLSSLGVGSLGADERYNLFTTIIYSRTFLEGMIDEFDLMEEYGQESLEKTIKQVSSSIEVELSPEMAYIITVRGNSPEKAVVLNNYLLEKVNGAVIELNVKKAKENRAFLEQRYSEIQYKLAKAEDSLQFFQQNTNILEVENQIKAIVEAYSKFESELALKEIEATVFEKIYGENSPQAQNSRIALETYRDEFNRIKSGKLDNSLFLSLSSLPKQAKDYVRLFREVEVYNAMVEFIIPLYEQTKFEEVKSIPVLQIIDRPSLPEKKSFPPRTLFTLIITFIIIFTTSQIIFFRDYLNKTENEKLKLIRAELFNFKRKSKIRES
jgi:uncharacterized protein involved in exopolysaccharide biosynthesis